MDRTLGLHATEAVLDFFDRDAAVKGFPVDPSVYGHFDLWGDAAPVQPDAKPKLPAHSVSKGPRGASEGSKLDLGSLFRPGGEGKKGKRAAGKSTGFVGTASKQHLEEDMGPLGSLLGGMRPGSLPVLDPSALTATIEREIGKIDAMHAAARQGGGQAGSAMEELPFPEDIDMSQLDPSMFQGMGGLEEEDRLNVEEGMGELGEIMSELLSAMDEEGIDSGDDQDGYASTGYDGDEEVEEDGGEEESIGEGEEANFMPFM
jgi:hypothetical protein